MNQNKLEPNSILFYFGNSIQFLFCCRWGHKTLKVLYIRGFVVPTIIMVNVYNTNTNYLHYLTIITFVFDRSKTCTTYNYNITLTY